MIIMRRFFRIFCHASQFDDISENDYDQEKVIMTIVRISGRGMSPFGYARKAILKQFR